MTEAIAWHRATSDDLLAYCDLVSSSLPTLPVEVTTCSEAGCTAHTAELDVYVDSLFHCLHDCARRTLPKLRASSSCVLGWNRAARILKDKANFWFNVWKSTGSPSSGVLFQIKKSRYKYEVRRLRRRELHIRWDRLALALATSRSRDFWLEVKRTTKPKRSNVLLILLMAFMVFKTLLIRLPLVSVVI